MKRKLRWANLNVSTLGLSSNIFRDNLSHPRRGISLLLFIPCVLKFLAEKSLLLLIVFVSQVLEQAILLGLRVPTFESKRKSTVRKKDGDWYIYLQIITKSMRALSLVNQLWFIVSVNPWKNRASSELLYKSNRPQVSMVYRLINHLGRCSNTERIRKSLACCSWFTNSQFSCFTNIPRGLSAYKP